MDCIQISKYRIEELQTELKQLKASLLSDNEEGTKMGGPMDSFKEAAAFQVMIGAKSQRVKELEEILKVAEVLPEEVPGSSVIIGKWFSINNGASLNRYRLVHPLEAEPAKGLVSPDSPLGKAVIDQKIGYLFTLNKRECKIQNVE